MKKILMLAACTAAMTAITSCSSNDDDVLPQATVAPAAGESVAEGTPLKVKLVDITRGTDWVTATLPKFTLFSTANGGTTRWLGARTDATVSAGVDFTNTAGVFAPASTIDWMDGTWDFYAVSDATFATEDDGNGGEQDAEHLDAASRNFTYEVPTDYASQTDLLVGAAIGKSKSEGDVEIPFYHALARIEKFMVYFKQLKSNTEDDKIASNSTRCFLIKSITLKNVVKKGTFTFPAAWAAPDGDSWTPSAITGDYAIELADFERETNGSIKIFTEYQNPTNTAASQNIPTGLDLSAKRAGTNVPNIISTNYTRTELPIAAGDQGLYLLPQELESTVTGVGTSYTITGPYVEIEGFIFTNPDAWSDVAEYITYAEETDDSDEKELFYAAAQDAGYTALKQGEGGASAVGGICNNYNFTHTAMSKFACPITATLLPNKRYVLNIDLSYILTRATNGEYVFSAADIKI